MTLKEYGIAKNGVLCNDKIICECGTVLNTDASQCPRCHNNLSKRNLKKVQPDKEFGEKIYMKKDGDSYYFSYEKLIVSKNGEKLNTSRKYYLDVTKESIEFNFLRSKKLLTLVEKELPGLVTGIKYLKFTKQEEYKDFSYLAKLYFKVSPLFINKSFQDLERLKIINPDHRTHVYSNKNNYCIENTVLSFFDMYPHIDFNDENQWFFDMNYIGIVAQGFICLNHFIESHKMNERYDWNEAFKKIQEHPYKEILLQILEHAFSNLIIENSYVTYHGNSTFYSDYFCLFIKKILNNDIDENFYHCFIKCSHEKDDIITLTRLIFESEKYQMNINWAEITNFQTAYQKLNFLIKEKDNPSNTKKIQDAYSLVNKNPFKALELLASIEGLYSD